MGGTTIVFIELEIKVVLICTLLYESYVEFLTKCTCFICFLTDDNVDPGFVFEFSCKKGKLDINHVQRIINISLKIKNFIGFTVTLKVCRKTLNVRSLLLKIKANT